MAKLRKTLGSPTEPAVVALMEGMEGKSKETLTTWAMAYVTEKYLPLVAEVPLFSELLGKTTDCMAGSLPMKEWKGLLSDARKVSAAKRSLYGKRRQEPLSLPVAHGRRPPMLWDSVFMG